MGGKAAPGTLIWQHRDRNRLLENRSPLLARSPMQRTASSCITRWAPSKLLTRCSCRTRVRLKRRSCSTYTLAQRLQSTACVKIDALVCLCSRWTLWRLCTEPMLQQKTEAKRPTMLRHLAQMEQTYAERVLSTQL